MIIVAVERLKPEDVAAAVDIEETAGLKSRGIEGHLKAIGDPTSVLLVAKVDDQIVGIFSGLVVIDELQIDNIAVKKEFRLQGVGDGLLSAAIYEAVEMGAKTAVLEVRSRNAPAISLYIQSGFQIAGTRPSYYHNPVDDALIMSCNIECARRYR